MKKFRSWVLVFGWAYLIFYLSGIPFLETGLPYDFELRKRAHVFEFFVLTFFLRNALKETFKLTQRRLLIYAAALSILYACSDEFHQMFVPGRMSSLRDVCIDSIGVFGFLILSKVLARKKSFLIFLAFCSALLFQGKAWCEEPCRRGLFVMVLQEPAVLSSAKRMDELVLTAQRTGTTDLFVQVYRADQAWFASTMADQSPYEACYRGLSQDPLKLLIKKAHQKGIKVHAWLNMLSLSRNKQARLLKKYGRSILTSNREAKNDISDYSIDGQYFLEPGDPRTIGDLCAMVKEFVAGYAELDGIMFDYVRYPDMHPAYGYTKANIERFKRATGSDSVEEDSSAWKDWKRSQVTLALKNFVNAARGAKTGITVSATGCMPYSRAFFEAFQDWPAWLKSGLVDFVAIMDYSPDHSEFERWINDVKDKVPDLSKVYIAVGAYKLVDRPDEFAKEFRFSEASGCGGSIVFHYGSLLENPELSEQLKKCTR